MGCRLRGRKPCHRSKNQPYLLISTLREELREWNQMFIIYLINKETFSPPPVLPGSAGNLPVMSTMLGLSCQDELAVHTNAQQFTAMPRGVPHFSGHWVEPICKTQNTTLDTWPAEQYQHTCSSSTCPGQLSS